MNNYTTENEYFVNYFDLNTDYNNIKDILNKNKTLSKMIPYGYGIRILNADTHEMIFSYIISQNNNIKRIQKIIEDVYLKMEGKKGNGAPFVSLDEVLNEMKN